MKSIAERNLNAVAGRATTQGNIISDRGIITELRALDLAPKKIIDGMGNERDPEEYEEHAESLEEE
jgi:hypothetical protein